MTEEGFKYRLIFFNHEMYMYGQKNAKKILVYKREGLFFILPS